jgi:hypothetical protein
LQRILSTAVLLGLLIATAAAFAVTEKLKLEKSPVYGTIVTQRFGPTCRCATNRALISVKIRRPDTVTVTILTSGHRPVRTLVSELPVKRGRTVFRWDGRTDTGELAPDRTYVAQIHLAKRHTTIVLPNKIVLDTVPPEVVATPNRPAFSPDGDHQADSVVIRYTLSEDGHVNVYLHGRLLIRGRNQGTTGTVTWSGHVDGHLHRPGPVVLTVAGVDLAGNRTPVARRSEVRVTIRYITLASRVIAAHAGRRFDIGVSTDARRYRWQLGSRHGIARGPVLRLRAPAQAGRVALFVTAHGHSDRAVVVVR